MMMITIIIMIVIIIIIIIIKRMLYSLFKLSKDVFKLRIKEDYKAGKTHIYVVVNFLSQLIFIFPLFWDIVIYANEFETKEK